MERLTIAKVFFQGIAVMTISVVAASILAWASQVLVVGRRTVSVSVSHLAILMLCRVFDGNT